MRNGNNLPFSFTRASRDIPCKMLSIEKIIDVYVHNHVNCIKEKT